SLQAEAGRRDFAPPLASAASRRSQAFGLAADAEVRVSFARPAFVGVRVLDPGGLNREIFGGGLVRHYRLDRLEELVSFAREDDQTVTYFGWEGGELADLARRLGERGLDRLVPVGDALAFDTLWDGYDLLDDFTRR